MALRGSSKLSGMAPVFSVKASGVPALSDTRVWTFLKRASVSLPAATWLTILLKMPLESLSLFLHPLP